MGINSTLESLSLSGKKAKRRTINCSNGNLLNCYFGIVNNNNKNNNTSIINKRDIILQAIKKLQDTEALIQIELAKQSEANFGFTDATLGRNLKNITAFKTLLTNSDIDSFYAFEMSINLLEKIDNGMTSDAAALDLFDQAIKGSYGDRIATALTKAARRQNVTIGFPSILPPDNLDKPSNLENPDNFEPN